jgi:hypothetical protein
MSERSTEPFDTNEISAWLQREEGMAADRAEGAARELASSWSEGDFDYQTTKDIVGDYLADDESRPKFVADAVAEAFGVTLI